MKFGKSIRAEARNNRGLSFINFKYLKRILKRCGSAVKAGSRDLAREEDRQFSSILESELRKVGESYWKELQHISNLQNLITQKLPLLDIKPDPATYTRMGFEQLQAHLQSLGGLNEVPSCGDCSTSSVKTSAALCEFCVNLGKISARCKRLRRCVLWNAVAVVKILKKRQKHTAFPNSEVFSSQWDSIRETAVQVLTRQDWYCCDQLPRIVSIVETTIDELMQRLTLTPPNRDQYQCPICLDVVLDPVCLRTCGHRFCWACLCMAYCEKPEGTLERCPCCRAAFPLDPEAFEVDGILSRFLRDFFPEDQSVRLKEQRENLRQRLEVVQRHQEQRCKVEDELDVVDLILSEPMDELQESDHHHCCPDCSIESDISECHHIGQQHDSLVKLSTLTPPTINAPLIRTASEWLNAQDLEPEKTSRSSSSKNHKKSQKGCRHELNVKQGKPSDVDRLAFSRPKIHSYISTSSPTLESPSSEVPVIPQNFTSGTIRSVSSTTSCASLGSSTSACKVVIEPEVDKVVDSVVAALLNETPHRSPSPSPDYLSSESKDSKLPFLLDNNSSFFWSSDQRAEEGGNPFVDDFLSECRLPSVNTNGIFGGGSSDWMGTSDEFEYYESVDDDDDRIEEEYRLSTAQINWTETPSETPSDSLTSILLRVM